MNTVRSRDSVIAVLVLLATSLLYLQVLGLGAVAIDDPEYLTHNARVQAGLSFDGVAWAFADFETSSNYQPITLISHQIAVSLFGMNLAAMHAVNALLHAANAALLYLLARRLLRSRVSAVVVAAVFAAHPQHVESVAWLSERKDVLSGFFFVAMLLAYVVGHQEKRPVLRVLSVVFFVFGLLSKPMLVTAPAVLVLLDVAVLGRLQTAGMRRIVVEKLPLLASSLLDAWITVGAQQGAMAPLDQLTVSMRLVNAVSSLGRYLELFVLPVDLSPFYTLRLSDLTWGRAVVPVVVVGAVSIGVVFVALRTRALLPLAGWLWFLGMLVPVIGAVQVGSQSMADRYTYLPHIGLVLGLAALVELTDNVKILRPIALFSGGWMCMLAAFTWLQIPIWTSHETLFRWALQVNPDDAVANGVVAGFDLDAGDVDAAIAHGEVAVAGAGRDARVRENLARAYLRAGRVDDADAHLRRLLREQPSGAVWRMLGDVDRRRGDPAAALKKYQVAARSGESIVFEIASTQLDLGQVDAASAALTQLIEAIGDNAVFPKLELARARVLQGAPEQARVLLVQVRAVAVANEDAALVARVDADLAALLPR